MVGGGAGRTGGDYQSKSGKGNTSGRVEDDCQTWSDFALFSIFENLYISADQVYFQELNSKKSAISAGRVGHARQSFHFQKITGTLKINIFF